MPTPSTGTWAASERAGPEERRGVDTVRVVAFGGGHGLGASLRALRRCAPGGRPLRLTAVVTVGDNGGSSGRLRAQRHVLPPGDLRQALAALAADDPHHTITAELFQHRFAGTDRTTADSAADSTADPAGGSVEPGGELVGHPVGNLVLCGLMELLGDPVAALDRAAAMVGAVGRVLPMSCEPVEIEASVRGGDPARPAAVVTVRGQHEVAVSSGQVEAVRLDPATPAACAEALAAVAEADWLVFGPGSWYTSVIPHLLVPELAAAVTASAARRLVVLNLTVERETAGLTLPAHLTALASYLPGLRADVVLGDAGWVTDPGPVRLAAAVLGAELVLAPVARRAEPVHDPQALAAALLPVLSAGTVGATPQTGAR